MISLGGQEGRGKKLVVGAWVVYALWGERGMEYWIMQGMVEACENSSPADPVFSEKLEVKSLTKREMGRRHWKL